MRVAKWGNSLAVRLPDAIVKALKLKSGDEIEIVVTGERAFQVERDTSRERALETNPRPVSAAPASIDHPPRQR